jgi:IS5 family transposase
LPGRSPSKKIVTLTKEKILKILADVTEQPIQRPKKASKQKASYSGKKKRHTQKMGLIVTGEGKIVSTSASYPGRCHDFYIRKEEKPLPKGADKYVDSGYQGLQKRTDSVHLPEKKKRKQPLTQEQRKHNQALASVRIAVEHKIREIKIFKILSEVYRNFQSKHHMRFNIIAAVVNFKHGF